MAVFKIGKLELDLAPANNDKDFRKLKDTDFLKKQLHSDKLIYIWRCPDKGKKLDDDAEIRIASDFFFQDFKETKKRIRTLAEKAMFLDLLYETNLSPSGLTDEVTKTFPDFVFKPKLDAAIDKYKLGHSFNLVLQVSYMMIVATPKGLKNPPKYFIRVPVKAVVMIDFVGTCGDAELHATRYLPFKVPLGDLSTSLYEDYLRQSMLDLLDSLSPQKPGEEPWKPMIPGVNEGDDNPFGD